MILAYQKDLADRIRRTVSDAFGVTLGEILVQTTPRLDLGDMALPLAFDLAKKIGRKPREIAQELVPRLADIKGVARAEVAGGGFINLFLDRSEFTTRLHSFATAPPAKADIKGRVIVEHTSINPNKAAHIGHVRNSILGDTFVRLLKARGHDVLTQNYIDDTGVQVADVIVGFERLEHKTLADVRALDQRFDYYCWDLYARVFEWYGEDKERKALQAATLHAIEKHEGETAALGEYVAARIVRAHIATMRRLDIGYDLLVRESDILRQHFWARAFELLKETKAIEFTEEGKAKGCWVLKMDRGEATGAVSQGDVQSNSPEGAGTVSGPRSARESGSASPIGAQGDSVARAATQENTPNPIPGGSPRGAGSASGPRSGTESGSASPITAQGDSVARAGTQENTPNPIPGGSPRGAGSASGPLRTQQDAPPRTQPDDEDKIIVRSNGTVTYTGKDIAYQLWKLGKLGLDFRYRRHEDSTPERPMWSSTSGSADDGAPPFGAGACLVFNVIDVGQSYPQRVVKAGVAAVAGPKPAEGTHHLGYEKVVLSKATARELGYEVDEEAAVVKVSGRRGLGVKADDLIDALEAKASNEIATRDPERAQADREKAARDIAVGALRYFMLRFSRNRIITFDMEEALAFTGETGPYIQNSVVRARSILTKVAGDGHDLAALMTRALDPELLSSWLKTEEGSSAWSLFLAMARTEDAIETAVRTEEPSVMTRHAFQIAQAFHGYYQNPAHSVLRAETEDLRAIRVLVVDLFVRHMTDVARILGIPIPDRM
jgi:arginyl-tRNA synthetase